jgi:hypothetical protein
MVLLKTLRAAIPLLLLTLSVSCGDSTHSSIGYEAFVLDGSIKDDAGKPYSAARLWVEHRYDGCLTECSGRNAFASDAKGEFSRLVMFAIRSRPESEYWLVVDAGDAATFPRQEVQVLVQASSRPPYPSVAVDVTVPAR